VRSPWAYAVAADCISKALADVDPYAVYLTGGCCLCPCSRGCPNVDVHGVTVCMYAGRGKPVSPVRAQFRQCSVFDWGAPSSIKRRPPRSSNQPLPLPSQHGRSRSESRNKSKTGGVCLRPAPGVCICDSPGLLTLLTGGLLRCCAILSFAEYCPHDRRWQQERPESTCWSRWAARMEL
jgi:hypothetical protein